MLLTGRGEIRIADKSIGQAEYKISVQQSGHTRRATGRIWAHNDVLLEAYEARDITLIREDCGFAMSLSVTNHSAFDTMAQVTVNGSPGPSVD